MSGGSYNYLCYGDEVQDLDEKYESLEAMEAALRKRGYEKAADETKVLKEKVDVIRRLQSEEISQKLKNLWRAIEWCESLDWGEDKVTEAIEEYHQS